MRRLKLCFVHLYPDMTGFYGDRGNLISLVMRARWNGFSVDVKDISLGDKQKIADADCILLGGGQGLEQKRIISKELLQKSPEIHYCAAKGVPILAICGGFQLLGKYYLTSEGEEIQGISLLDCWTVAGQKRMVGNIALRVNLAYGAEIIVGFENHVGKTFLGTKALPWGQVLKGYGNNGEDGEEGASHQNVLGTYLHGPLLPKNPRLTDYILEKAVGNKYPGARLRLLDGKFEKAAHQKILKKLGVKQEAKRGKACH